MLDLPMYAFLSGEEEEGPAAGDENGSNKFG